MLKGTKETMEEQENITVEEAAKLLRVSKATCWAWCKRNKLPAFKMPGSRRWLINKAELERLQKRLIKEYEQ